MELRRKKFWLTFWSLLMGFLVCWGAAEGKERVVTIGDTSVLRSIDPPFIAIGVDIMLARNVYQSLLRYKFNTSEIEPELAKSWTISSDGTVYTFKLRDDVKWHKGFGKFTAHDVKYTFDRIMDEKTGSPTRSEIVVDLKEVKVLDDYTVQFILKGPYKPFLHKMIGPRNVSMVNKAAIEKFGKEYNRNAIGTGPFYLDTWDRNGAVLIANKEFHEGAPKIDKVVFKTVPDPETMVMALQKGDIDMIWIMPRDKATIDRLNAAGIKITYSKRPVWQNLWMNNKAKPFDNVLVRRAVAHAIDKDTLIKYVLDGFAERLDSPVPKGAFGHSEEGIPKYEFSPEKAKALLAQAGYPNGFETSMDTFQSPNYLPLATAIAEQLRKVNITVKLSVTDQSTWWGKLSKGTSNLTLLMPAAQPDADFPLFRYYHSSSFPPGFNVCKYDGIDALIEKGRSEMNEKKRLGYYLEAQKKFMEDVPGVPLLMMGYPIPHKKNISNLPNWDVFFGIDFYHLQMAD
jgi:peptide/nickel transport system substrate-binding protein